MGFNLFKEVANTIDYAVSPLVETAGKWQDIYSGASKNREWQEKMSNTAHQRQIEDLKAAGINPLMTATGGSGAPVGSGAQSGADLIGDMAGIATGGAGVANAITSAKAQASQDLVNSSIEMNNKANTAKTLAMTEPMVEQINKDIKIADEKLKDMPVERRKTYLENKKREVTSKGWDIANEIIKNSAGSAKSIVNTMKTGAKGLYNKAKRWFK